jgi:hypothetical protein
MDADPKVVRSIEAFLARTVEDFKDAVANEAAL